MKILFFISLIFTLHVPNWHYSNRSRRGDYLPENPKLSTNKALWYYRETGKHFLDTGASGKMDTNYAKIVNLFLHNNTPYINKNQTVIVDDPKLTPINAQATPYEIIDTRRSPI